MNIIERHTLIGALLDDIRNESFKDPNSVSDADAMGLLIARYFDEHPTPIIKAAASALEDANAHGLAAYLREYAK